MRSQEGQRDPNVYHYATDSYGHFLPPHGNVLRRIHSGRTHMAAEVEVISIEIWHCQRYYAGVTPQKTDWSAHQEDCLNHISGRVEQQKRADYSQSGAISEVDVEKREHHEVNAD